MCTINGLGPHCVDGDLCGAGRDVTSWSWAKVQWMSYEQKGCEIFYGFCLSSMLIQLCNHVLCLAYLPSVSIILSNVIKYKKKNLPTLVFN